MNEPKRKNSYESEDDPSQPLTFEEQYERMIKKQLGGYLADYTTL